MSRVIPLLPPSFVAAWHVTGKLLFVFPRNLLPLFCFEDGDDGFLRNAGKFLPVYVQSRLRKQQLRTSVCLYALRCNAAKHISLSRF